MSSTQINLSVAKRLRPRGRWLLLIIAVVALAWSLPRPVLQDVVVGHIGEKSSADLSSPAIETPGRLAFRSVRRLSELAAKGPLADETELSGPCLADDGQSLYFARSRPGQRADIVLAHRDGERWSRAEPVRELNSVDDDRRVTIDAKGRSLLLASNRSGTRGGFDLYESSRVRDHWSKPKSVSGSLNTADDEFDPSLSSDGLTLYFVRKASGETADIFESHRSAIDADWPAPQAVAAVNSPLSHERSPAISPDGKFLYFASNRAARSGDASMSVGRAPLPVSGAAAGKRARSTNATTVAPLLSSEESQFDLFRAPLQNGVVRSPTLVQDGIASAADDVDAAFSTDGRTLVFASKREGPKQLYLSHADVVVSRLSWDIEHLVRFGRAKWAVPVLCGIFFLWAIRRVRRTAALPVAGVDQKRAVVVVADQLKTMKAERLQPPKRASEPTVSPERRVATIDQPKQRSAAPKNPLANWPVEPSVSTTASNSSKSNDATTNKRDSTRPDRTASSRAAATDATVSVPEPKPRGRRRFGAAVVTVALAAGLLVAWQPTLRWRQWDEPVLHSDESLSSLVQFRDISAVRFAEQKPLGRTMTARTVAPSSLAEPLDLTALRQASRWPSTLAVVRSKSAIDRVAEDLPELIRMVKQLVVVRHSISSSMMSAREAVADEAEPVASNIASEKVISTASTLFAKQLVDLSPSQRTTPQPAAATSAALRLPQSRAVLMSAMATTNGVAVVQTQLMPRAGAASRANGSAELPQPETSLPASSVAMNEQPFVPQLVVMNRSVVADVGSVPVLSQQSSAISNVVARPSLTIGVAREAIEPVLNNSTLMTPIVRQPSEPKFAPIVEEPMSQTSKATDVELLVTSKPFPLDRTETIGPMSVSVVASAIAAKEPVLVRRNDSAVVAFASMNLVPLKTSEAGSISRRELPQLATVVVNVDEEILKVSNGGPGLLLTSATQFVELLPPAILSAMTKFLAVGPTPLLAVVSDGGSTKWLPRVNVPRTVVEARTESSPVSLGQIVSLPRQIKDAPVVGIDEEVKPVDP